MRNDSRQHGPGIERYLLCGLFIAGFYAVVLTYQHYTLNSGTAVRLPTTIKSIDNQGLANTVVFQTSLNRISVTKLSGENSFVSGEKIHIFLSAGPDDIWYPYAISKRAPEKGCSGDMCLVMTGIVRTVHLDHIEIDYQFEKFYPNSRDFTLFRSVETPEQFEMTLRVNSTGRAVLQKINLNDQIIDQRNLLKFAPPGSNNLGASNTPATNPPK